MSLLDSLGCCRLLHVRPLFVQVAIGSLMMPRYTYCIVFLEASAMFRDPGIIIGLIFVGFFMGLLFHVKSYDCAIGQVAPTPTAAATQHVYRHSPYAIPWQ